MLQGVRVRVPASPPLLQMEGLIGDSGLKTTVDHSLKLAKKKASSSEAFFYLETNVLRFRFVQTWGLWDSVFCEADGTPLSRFAITRRFQNILASAGIERHRFHDFRHSCATLLLAQGVQIGVVMETFGQPHVATDADIYSHILPVLMTDAADKMNSALNGV